VLLQKPPAAKPAAFLLPENRALTPVLEKFFFRQGRAGDAQHGP
jgi:hypothetical protein